MRSPTCWSSAPTGISSSRSRATSCWPPWKPPCPEGAIGPSYLVVRARSVSEATLADAAGSDGQATLADAAGSDNDAAGSDGQDSPLEPVHHLPDRVKLAPAAAAQFG